MPQNTSRPLSIQTIPLNKIMANPYQPRRRFRRGSIEEMRDSLKAIGQQTLLKVRPLTEEEKALYPGFEYMVIGGHRRLAGAKLAGFETLDCLILPITPAETHLASLMDNNLDEMDWWDWDLAIEEEKRANPNMRQKEIGERLGKDKSKVSLAMNLLPLLNPATRELITRNLDQAKAAEDGKFLPPEKSQAGEEEKFLPPEKSKPEYEITESILVVLADLSDPLVIEKAINWVIENKLNESKAKKLVEWVKNGGKMEEFGKKEDSSDLSDEKDPMEGMWKSMVPPVGVEFKGGEDYEFKVAVKGGRTASTIYQAVRAVLEWEEVPFVDYSVVSPKDRDPLALDWKCLKPEIKVKVKGGEKYEITWAVSGKDKAYQTANSARFMLDWVQPHEKSEVKQTPDNPESDSEEDAEIKPHPFDAIPDSMFARGRCLTKDEKHIIWTAGKAALEIYYDGKPDWQIVHYKNLAKSKEERILAEVKEIEEWKKREEASVS